MKLAERIFGYTVLAFCTVMFVISLARGLPKSSVINFVACVVMMRGLWGKK